MEKRGFFGKIAQNYFTFSGRLNRKPFLFRSIAATVIPVLLAIALFFVFAGGFRPNMEYQHKDLMWLHVFLHSLLIILAIVSGFSLGVRRCHDLDKGGWWLLLGMVPYINVAWGLYLICKRGTVGKNSYGDDPIRDDFDKIEDIQDQLRQRQENSGK